MKKFLSLTCLLTALAASLFAKPSFNMINAECNVENGFNYIGAGYDFSYRNTVPIGYIKKLTINGHEIDADFKVNDLKDHDSKRAVVAVLDFIEWTGAPNDPISLTGRFSPKGKAAVLEALCSSNDQPKIALEWIVYDYDHQVQQYFPFFHTQGKAINLTLAEKYSFNASPNPNRETKMPVNFQLSFKLTPPQGHVEQPLAVVFRADGKTFSLPVTSSYDSGDQ